MKNILLATDLGANSDRAMERSFKLAKESGAVLHILYVLTKENSDGDNESVKKDTVDKVTAYMKDYKDADGLDVVIDVIQSKKPHTAIPEFASEINAELIIMGTHGTVKFRDLFLGTTAERVLTNTATPVLLVKDKPVGSYKKVLCGIDFAPASRDAFREAISIVPDAVFELIHTYEDPPIYPNPQFLNTMGLHNMSEEEREREMVKFINTETENFQKTYKDKTIKLKHTFLKSDPYYALVQEAEKKKIDLICVGAYREASEKIGAITDSLMTDPPCDILISGAR